MKQTRAQKAASTIRLIRSAKAAAERANRALEDLLQPGKFVTWKVGCKGIQAGVVIMFSSGLGNVNQSRVKVRNQRTGVEYWIYVWSLIDPNIRGLP